MVDFERVNAVPYEFPIPNDVIPHTLKLPFNYRLRQNETFKFRLVSAIINAQEVDSLQVEYETLRYSHKTGMVGRMDVWCQRRLEKDQ